MTTLLFFLSAYLRLRLLFILFTDIQFHSTKKQILTDQVGYLYNIGVVERNSLQSPVSYYWGFLNKNNRIKTETKTVPLLCDI